jgi:hypothetical protein
MLPPHILHAQSYARQLPARKSPRPSGAIDGSAGGGTGTPGGSVDLTMPDGTPPAWQDNYQSIPTDTGSYDIDQIADPAGAQKWIDVAVRLTSSAAEAYLMVKPFAEQKAAVANAWEAIARVYRYLNLSPAEDPALDAINAGWRGPVGATFPFCKAGAPRPAAVVPSGSYALPQFDFRAMLSRFGAPSLPIVTYNPWFYLDDQAKIKTNAPTGAEDYCADMCGLLSRDPCSPVMYPCDSTQHTDSWFRLRWTQPNALSAFSAATQTIQLVRPLYVFFIWARDIAQSMQARGPAEMIRQIRLNILRNNMINANCWGLLDDTTDPFGTLRVTAAAAANAVPGTLLDQNTTTGKQIAAAGETLAVAAISSGNPYAAIAGVILLAIVEALKYTPASTAYFADGYGRRAPVFAAPYLDPRAAPPAPPVGGASSSISLSGVKNGAVVPRAPAAPPPAAGPSLLARWSALPAGAKWAILGVAGSAIAAGSYAYLAPKRK